ncbi:MAG: aminoacyl-histidine dipeptidase [Bacteroidales bacterium]|nr:aminoacyl-histidine dipeptidase [Bacteroidales bacterium]
MDSNTVLEIFKEITRIPRESGHEAPMTRYLLDWAESNGLAAKRDEIGNVLITKEASKGKENVPVLVLQAHQDMVCEKNANVSHDFLKDPIEYVIEDGWMIAKDTTLGADDGIGIAGCLALLKSDLPTGKLECLFTISEETGMDGAEALEKGFFTGNTLINLDSEDEGQMFIGCAGGVNTEAVFKYDRVPTGGKAVRVKICGAIGGHSGDDINKERVNTVQQMARFLYPEIKAGARLVSVDGGGKTNAIARECEAVIITEDTAGLKNRFVSFGSDLKAEYRISDPGLQFETEDIEALYHIDASTAFNLTASLLSCPHGVQAMSQDIKGLVETSNNLASVKTLEDTIVIGTSQRSSIMSARGAMADKVAANFEVAGAEVKHFNWYPGWKPNVDSPVLKLCVESYRKLFGKDPLVLAIHAGLECGLFLEKFPELDMISFGPTLRGVHAPGEKLELASLDKFVAHLEDVVVNFR